jgi:transposase
MRKQIEQTSTMSIEMYTALIDKRTLKLLTNTSRDAKINQRTIYYFAGVEIMLDCFEIVTKILERYFGKRGTKVIICLILMIHGVTHTEIRDKYCVALSTTRRYRKAIENGKAEDLFVVAPRTRERSKLDDYATEILADFEENPPRTLREAQSRIEILTGIKRSLPRISAWCLKRGFVRLL